MNNHIAKPMSVVRQEFIDKLVNEINSCQLPMFVIEPILQDMLNVVRTTAKQQYEIEKAQYEQQLSKSNEMSSSN